MSMTAAPAPEAAPLHAYRAALLWFAPDHTDAHGQPAARYEADGLLVVVWDGAVADGVWRVRAVGAYRDLRAVYPDVAVTHWPGRLIAPGFIDLHLHCPQTDVVGSPAEGLLPWLERYTYPHETHCADPAYATEVAGVFLDELQRHGVTTALAFASSHPVAADTLLAQAHQRGLRLMAGKVLQDRHSPDGVRDATDQSLTDTETLIQHWHGVGRLGYAITPRFAPSCSDAQLRGAAELAARYPDVWVQTHVAENLDEVRWVRELYPHDRSYLSVYQRFGLLRPRAVYAHGIHLDEYDRALLRDSGSAVAVCPSSNFFLGSGCFDFASADAAGFAYGLASDIGAGTSFSPFHTMLAAYAAGRSDSVAAGHAKPGVSLAPSRLWWLHTAGAAQALGLGGVVGSLCVGSEADFVVLNPRATPLLARRSAQAQNLEELLFALIVLGDDRAVERTVLASGNFAA